MNRPCRAGLLVLALLARGASAEDAPAAPDFDEVELEAGLSVGFGIQRLGGNAPPESSGLGSHVVKRTNRITRLLVDEESGAAFGYRLEAAAVSTSPLHVRVDLRPLQAGDESDLKRLTTCAKCPPPHFASKGPVRFPPTHIVRSGDTMVVDLLVRPDTGEKIVDVLKFSREAVTREELEAVRGRLRQASLHVRRGDEIVGAGPQGLGAFAESSRVLVEAASLEYTKALALQSDSATHLRLAVCYDRLERPEAAEKEYEKAVRLNEADAEAWHRLSTLRHRRGRYAKAVEGYRTALKLRPDWALARRNLATALLDRAELQPAFEEYRHAHRIAPSILETKDAGAVATKSGALQQFLFAKVHAAAGALESAFESLKRARDLGFTDLERVREEPEFAPLLKDPRVVGLIGRGAPS
jgi:tetratricopeptide (TPR) repeat protein